jgi:hypothetical protein
MIATNLKKIIPGNEDISYSSVAHEPLAQAKTKCWFTFVRPPAERFAAGYAEFEDILQKGATAESLSEMDDYGLTFHKLHVGSAERAKAFISDVIALRWDVTEAKPAALWFKNAFEHVLPMTSSTHNINFDFVGRLDPQFVHKDWECMKSVCEAKTGSSLAALDFDRKVVHGASGGWKKHESAMEQALQESVKLRCALFVLLRHDYVDFAYDPPVECKKFKASVSEASRSFHTRGAGSEPESFQWFDSATNSKCGKAVNPRIVQKPKEGSAVTVLTVPHKRTKRSLRKGGPRPRREPATTAAYAATNAMKRASLEAEEWFTMRREMKHMKEMGWKSVGRARQSWCKTHEC